MSDSIEETLSKVHIREVTGENVDGTHPESEEQSPEVSPELLEHFLTIHRPQLQASGVPEHFWPSLCLKLQERQYDAGINFEMLCEEGASALCCHARALTDIDPRNTVCIYLIDHALHFKPKTLRYALYQLPADLQRFKEMFGIDSDDEADDSDEEDEVLNTEETRTSNKATAVDTESSRKGKATMSQSASDSSGIYDIARKTDDMVISKLLQIIWKRAMTYTVRTKTEEYGEEDTPIWYLMDEFGMSIGHSKTPNFRIVPFFYAYDHTAYSLLFPVQEVKKGDVITRDYLATQIYQKHPEWESTLLIPWTPLDLRGSDIPRCTYPESYFCIGRQVDSLPANEVERRLCKATDTIKIFTDDTQLIEHMTKLKYELVDSLAETDVVWLRTHFYDFKYSYRVESNVLPRNTR